MKWFYDLKVGTKLITAFIIVSAITAIVGLMGIRNMSRINDMADVMYERELLGISYVKEANINLIYVTRNEKNLLLSSTNEQRQNFFDQIQKDRGLFEENMKNAAPLFYSEKGKELLARAKQYWEDYRKVHEQVMDLAKKEDLQEKRDSVNKTPGQRKRFPRQPRSWPLRLSSCRVL